MTVAVLTSRTASARLGDDATWTATLIEALGDAGHEVHDVAVRADLSSHTATLDSYARAYAVDLQDYDLVISTAAPTFMASHANHTSFLTGLRRESYQPLLMEPGPERDVRLAHQATVHALDRFGLRPGRIRRHFSRGHGLYRRLRRASAWWATIDAGVLHCPPALSGFKPPRAQRHILVAGRHDASSRVELLLDAYRHIPGDTPLLIAGNGIDDARLRALAGDDARIRFLGAVDDAELIELYADALVVACPSRHATHATAAIEAFKAGKPVLSCTDSGELRSFVGDGDTGYVVDPTVDAVAAGLRSAIDHPSDAAARGRRGTARVADVNWERVVDALTGRQRRSPLHRVRSAEPQLQPFRVLVLDGGTSDAPQSHRAGRLTGLFHSLGTDLRVTRVGVRDGEGRGIGTASLFESIDVPLGAAHRTSLADWQRRAGTTNADAAIAQHADHAPELVKQVRRRVAEAEIVVFWRPWLYPLVSDLLNPQRHLIVYAAQAVEGLEWTRACGDDDFGARLAAHAATLERTVCRAADIVLVSSHQQRTLFHELYDIPCRACVVVPDGTYTERRGNADAATRASARHALGLPPGPVACIVGQPLANDDALFVNGTLAPALPVVTFVLGDAGAAALTGRLAPNVRVIATSQEQRPALLDAADIAIDLATDRAPDTGALFDCLAAGVPVVTTTPGFSGVGGGTSGIVAVEPRDLVSAVARLLRDEPRATAMASAGRRLVAERHSWEQLSPALGRLLHRHRRALARPRPALSVIVATHGGHDALDVFLEYLARQTLQNFEVIVVAPGRRRRTPEPPGRNDLVYVADCGPGMASAWNAGAAHARAEVLAFTTDDCRPDANWLERALPYFLREGVVGVEGAIVSDRLHDPRFRAFTNVGADGRRFNAANLFLRREAFNALDGFDPQFDQLWPSHEGTDLASRAHDLGAVPFAADVCVYQPPQRRSRVQFFETPALPVPPLFDFNLSRGARHRELDARAWTTSRRRARLT